MSKNRIKIMSFFLLGTLIMTSCHREGKGEQIEGPEFTNGAYAEYPFDPTTTTTEIMPSFSGDYMTPSTEYVTPETSYTHFETETLPEEPTISNETYSEEEIFIPEETITPEETKKEEPIIPEKPINENIIVIATTNVNLRSAPTADSIQIDQLKIYDRAYKILSCENGWDLVWYNNNIGYVKSDYMDYTADTYETEYIHSKRNDIVITTSSLNFREQPASDSKRISTFEPNTELQVIATVDNGWLLVKYNSTLGYVHSGYVVSMLDRANELYPELQLTNLKPQHVVYTNTNLNFRTGNSTDFPSLGLLERYETLRVIGEYDGWYFVMTNDYNFGFVSANYTTILEDRYVIVDKSEQQLYLYDDNELLYTTPVTTGKDETPSDTGLFKINYKATDVVLSDNKTYWSPVRYWMPYNGGEGLHDADWRSVFGTDSYHYGGSHGCINMPVDITDEIYNNVETGTKVLVHK